MLPCIFFIILIRALHFSDCCVFYLYMVDKIATMSWISLILFVVFKGGGGEGRGRLR